MLSRKIWFCGSIGLFSLLCASALPAATITPNILTDPALVGAGVGTDCSLRYAVESINNGAFEGGCAAVSTGALGTNDEIILGEGTYLLQLDGNDSNNATGDLNMNSDFILTGAGSTLTTIDASELAPTGDRIMDINDITFGHIEGVTLTGGDVSTVGGGGAIFTQAVLLEIEEVHITENLGDFGGAIDAELGTMLINNSTIERNIAVECGGGISSFVSDIGINNSTLNNNESTDSDGGGICQEGDFLFLTNTTISSNTASGDGGGIFTEFGGSFNTAGLKGAYNVTIVLNEAGGSGGGIAGDQGAVPQGGTDPFPTRVFNSIIARNTANTGNDCANGDFQTGGFNLIGEIGPNDNCTDFVNGVNGDQVGAPGSAIDPLIGALAANGGPTQTHALLDGSPAIDKGNPAGCQALDVPNFFDTDNIVFNNLTTDQRGETRPVAILDPNTPICDIGAYELQVVVPTPTPTPTPIITPTPPPFVGFVEGSGCSLNPASAAAASGSLWIGLGLMAGFLGLKKKTRE